MDIAQELLNGNRLALTRAITAIENETAAAVEIMKKLYPYWACLCPWYYWPTRCR
jgi:LAO/AO transport system kinase